MSALAPTLQAFFTQRLIGQRQASPHTIAAYRDTLRLLVFAQQRTGIKPHALDIADLDATLITAFLDHLEHDRGNHPRTRNARLAAIRSLYHYAPTRPAPTARSNASTRHSSATGPTRSNTPQAKPVGKRCHTGSTTTTSAAPTQRSATAHPELAFGTSLGTTPRPAARAGLLVWQPACRPAPRSPTLR
jgi:Phage integrase, N-terminal SAM-like domain